MEAVREAWTDERLDDLANRMDRGFDRVDKDIRELRAETKTGFESFRGEVDRRFDKVDERFDKVDKRFDKVDARFDKMDERFDKMDERFGDLDERVHGRLDSIQRAIVAAAIAISTATSVAPPRSSLLC